MLQHTPNDTFDYGEPRGSLVLRMTLPAYLARGRGVLADPARIVLCAGYAHGLTVLGRALLDLGITETAFEDPSIHVFRDVATGVGQHVVGVPVDDHGLRVAELSSPTVVVTAAHQAPLGVTLAPARRTALTQTGAVIIEDDYDGEFRYDRQQVGALQALAPERVIYAGSVSKTLSPSLRLARAMNAPLLALGALNEAFIASGPSRSTHMLSELLRLLLRHLSFVLIVPSFRLVPS